VLAHVRAENKKTRQRLKAAAGILTWAVTQRGKSRVKRGLILSFFTSPLHPPETSLGTGSPPGGRGRIFK